MTLEQGAKFLYLRSMQGQLEGVRGARFGGTGRRGARNYVKTEKRVKRHNKLVKTKKSKIFRVNNYYKKSSKKFWRMDQRSLSKNCPG